MANKISVVIDVAVDKANRGIKSFQQAVKDADGAVGKFKAGSGAAFASLKANAGVAAVAVGASLVKLGATATNAASDLEQSIGGVEKAFGSASDSILKIGESAAESMGLSQRAFNEGALALSAFAEDIASDTGEPVEKVITDLMTRAADFAAAYGTTVPEAVRIFSSTLSGESEPIKRFGIIVNETETKAYAAEAGIEGMGKATQRAGLLMRDTNKFAGQFAEESGTLAGQQERLGAELENMMATLGEGLTPVVADATKVIRKLMDLLATAGENEVVQFGNKFGAFNNIFGTTLDMWDRGPGALISFVAAEKNATDATEELTVATSEHTSEMTVAREAMDAAADSSENLADSTGRTATQWEQSAKELEDLSDQLAENRERIEDLNEATLESIDSSLGYRNQTARTAEEIRKSTEIINDAESSAEDVAQAYRDAEGAALDQASAAVRMGDDQAKASGKTLTAQERTKIYRDELIKLKDTLNGDAAIAIQMHIDRLGNIPRSIATNVTTSFSAPARPGSSSGNAASRVVGRATGGTVNEPVTLVGERGPELVSLPNGSKVHTNQQSKGMLGAPNIYLTVNAGLGTDGRDVGRLIVEELQKYQRRNGPGSLP